MPFWYAALAILILLCIAKCRHTFYEHSNKCGKLLARALQAQQARTFIPELLDEHNTTAHATEKIADIFQQYYVSLYNLSHPTSAMEESSRMVAIQEYIQHSGLPCISDEDLTNLDKPLTAEEVALAIAHMKPGTVPVPDGYSLLYYRTFGDLLNPHFLHAHKCSRGGDYPAGGYTLGPYYYDPEWGKSPSALPKLKDQYLLNADLKIFTKILSMHLIALIPQ